MSSTPNLTHSIYSINKYTGSSTLHLHPHNPTLPKHGPGRSSMTSHCPYRYAKPTNNCLRSPPARRYPNPSNPGTHYYRNPKSIYSTTSPRCPTNSQSYSRPSSYPTNRNRCLCPNPPNANRSRPDSNSSCSSYSSRSRRSYDSGLCLCSFTKSLPTGKRLMAHQAHAYHIVDPSPWPLTGAVAALLITSGLAI